MIDILIINPGDRKKTFQTLGDKYAAIETPYWSVAIAAYLRDNNFSVHIIDADVEALTPKETASRVSDIKPTLTAIISHGSTPQSSTLNMASSSAIAKEIKGSCNTYIAISGIHPTALPEQTLEEEEVDFVIIGEGPITIKNLITAIKDKSDSFNKIEGLCFYDKDKNLIKNPPAPLISNLDETLHTAAWDLIPMKEYRSHFWHSFEDLTKTKPYAAIYSALGCKYNCSFCQINTLFGKPGMRYRSPEKVVDELGLLHEKYEIRNIKMSDELFIYDEHHYMPILEKCIERKYDLNFWAWARIDSVKLENLDKMKKAGINWLVFGIESANSEVRRQVGKPIRLDVEQIVKDTRSAGINVVANYIFGLPEDNWDTMNETFEQAMRINAEVANFYSAMAYPGTRLYKLAQKENWELPTEWSGFSQHSYEATPVPTKYLKAKDVLAFRDKAFLDYHNSPNYLNMIEGKFGTQAVNFIKEITEIKLERKLLAS